MEFSPTEVDESWHEFFERHRTLINNLLSQIAGAQFTPSRGEIFRAFQLPIDSIKVLIIGQDPYPGRGVADGLAFSSRAGNPIPASLRNIFLEYSSDLNLPQPTSADLSRWHSEGVFLLNRSLTTIDGERNAHSELGWREFTDAVATFLGDRPIVAILWGKYAQELSDHFPQQISSPHPSPLSAYRGFFGSRPFSRANELLAQMGRAEVNWTLQ
jgi:uracil-DNA glycosylase